jgi:predicted O-methyltransferase YrrM
VANRTIEMTDDVYAYLVKYGVDEAPILARLREETAKLPTAMMQIGPEQGAFMRWLAGTLGVRRAIEVGTYTGYSSLSVALALPPDGKLVCCDVSEEYTSVARRYWAEAGVADRIELRLAPAAQTLDALIAAGHAGSFDLAFIDADKGGYDTYYERCLTLLRTGGVVLIDNVLWDGRVADASVDDDSTRAIRAINAKVSADARVERCMVPIGDGLTLARKR